MGFMKKLTIVSNLVMKFATGRWYQFISVYVLLDSRLAGQDQLHASSASTDHAAEDFYLPTLIYT